MAEQTAELNVLERIMTEGKLARDETQEAYARDLLEEFIASVAEEGTTAPASTVALIEQKIAEIDALLTAQLDEVLAICQLKDFVSRLPQGLETPLGPGAQRLSGGEQQRLAIARALLLSPRLLLLDEATSELDAETEERLLSALQQARPALCCLVVSHRADRLHLWDGIWQVKEGQVALKEAI